jgi:ABC-2 type transport system permease protein
MRRAVFAHVAAPPAIAALLNGGVTWVGWRLPAPLSLAVVGVAGLVLLGIAIVQFSRTD